MRRPYVYTPEGKAAMVASSSRPKGRRSSHLMTCAGCGKMFEDPNYGRKRVRGAAFCSLACCNAYRVGDKSPTWRGGHPRYYGPDWRRIRREARARDGRRCRRCKIYSAHRPLDVHHIKPVGTFANPNDANTLENVISLCHGCHMFVEWHGMDFE